MKTRGPQSETTSPPPHTVDEISQSHPDADPRQGAEYQAALELEMWKEAQEKLFLKQVGVRESRWVDASAVNWCFISNCRFIFWRWNIYEPTTIYQCYMNVCSIYAKLYFTEKLSPVRFLLTFSARFTAPVGVTTSSTFDGLPCLPECTFLFFVLWTYGMYPHSDSTERYDGMPTNTKEEACSLPPVVGD